jgi:hypothetical protein
MREMTMIASFTSFTIWSPHFYVEGERDAERVRQRLR